MESNNLLTHRRRRPGGGRPQKTASVTLKDIQNDEECLDRQWNHNVALDGKLFLSRLRKNPDYVFIGLEFFGILVCIVALYYCYFHFDWFHYHVTRVYANLDHPHAQHLMGDKLLHG